MKLRVCSERVTKRSRSCLTFGGKSSRADPDPRRPSPWSACRPPAARQSHSDRSQMQINTGEARNSRRKIVMLSAPHEVCCQCRLPPANKRSHRRLLQFSLFGMMILCFAAYISWPVTQMRRFFIRTTTGSPKKAMSKHARA